MRRRRGPGPGPEVWTFTLSARALADLGTVGKELIRRGHPAAVIMDAALEWAAAELAAQILAARLTPDPVLCHPGPMTSPAPHHGPTANGGTAPHPPPDSN